MYFGNVPARVLRSVSVWKYLEGHKINGAELWFKDPHPSLMSFSIPLPWGRLLIWFTISLFLSANGNLCWWRSKVDPSWTCAGGPFSELYYLHFHVLLNIGKFYGIWLMLIVEMAALHQIERGGEEQEVEWPSWCTGLQSNRYLCEKC